LAEALGVNPETVTSPTFVIQKSFPLDVEGPLETLVHIDAYRLEKPEEIEKLNWRETLANPANIVVIEWPENIGVALPKNATIVSFKFIDENTREIVFN
jgi:tRNA threonylcarbamoyladenosine biosynthesis protein TsaE